MYEYPFQIMLPPEVSHSVMLQSNDRNGSQQFFLKAQMMPDPRMQLTTQRPEVSVLRADTPIMAFKPLSDDEASFVGNELQKPITSKIGGVAGVAAT